MKPWSTKTFSAPPYDTLKPPSKGPFDPHADDEDDDYGYDLQTNFAELAPEIFGAVLGEAAEKKSGYPGVQFQHGKYRRRSLPFEETKRIFEDLRLRCNGTLTHSGFRQILHMNPDIATGLGLGEQIPNADLFVFDAALNQKLASKRLQAAINQKSLYLHQIRYGEEEWEGRHVIFLEDFLKAFCDHVVQQAYLFLHENVDTRLMIEPAKAALTSSLMVPPGPQDVRLPQPSYGGTISPDFQFSAASGWDHRSQISVPPMVTTDEAASLFREMGLVPSQQISFADFARVLMQHPDHARRLGQKSLRFEELVAFFTGDFRTPELWLRFQQSLWPPERMGLARFENAAAMRLPRAERSLSRAEADKIFKLLDVNGSGAISHPEMIKGLRQHPHIAFKLGLPSVIRQQDGSRERYQEVFSHMDPYDVKAIDRANFLRYYSWEVAPEESLISDPYAKPPLGLPEPDSLYVLSPDEARIIFSQWDQDDKRELTREVLAKGLATHPESAKRLGLPSVLLEEDGSLHFFDSVWGHLKKPETSGFQPAGALAAVVTRDRFVDYFTTRLADRSRIFGRTGAGSGPVRVGLAGIGWIDDEAISPRTLKYNRNAAVQVPTPTPTPASCG